MVAVPIAVRSELSAAVDDPRLSDEELVERLRGGDDGAFRVLVTRHRPWLVRLSTRLLGNDVHAAEDLAQETLLKLHAAARTGRRLRVRPWLTVVARNASVDEHRRRRPELPGEVPEPPAAGEPMFGLDPALARAWSALGGRHREVLYLRELVGMSYREIASVMELSGSAVETLLFRARAALRREYERAGGSSFGCGILGLGLYRFADGGRSGTAAAHVSACEACRRAADVLRAGSFPAAPVSVDSTSPGRGAGLTRLAGNVEARIGDVAPGVWAPLSGAEPAMAKLVSAGAAIVAAALPVLLAGSLATGPRRPAAPMTTAAAPTAAAAGGPVTSPSEPERSLAAVAAAPPGGAAPPATARAGDASPDASLDGAAPVTRPNPTVPSAGQALAEPRVRTDGLDTPAPPRPPLRGNAARPALGDELASAPEIRRAGLLRPKAVRDGHGPSRLEHLVARFVQSPLTGAGADTTPVPVLDPGLDAGDPARRPEASDPVADRPAASDDSVPESPEVEAEAVDPPGTAGGDPRLRLQP